MPLFLLLLLLLIPTYCIPDESQHIWSYSSNVFSYQVTDNIFNVFCLNGWVLHTANLCSVCMFLAIKYKLKPNFFPPPPVFSVYYSTSDFSCEGFSEILLHFLCSSLPVWLFSSHFLFPVWRRFECGNVRQEERKRSCWICNCEGSCKYLTLGLILFVMAPPFCLLKTLRSVSCIFRKPHFFPSEFCEIPVH